MQGLFYGSVAAMRKCLFCANVATSHEHYFPEWIYDLETSTPPYVLTVGAHKPISVYRENAKTKQVCEDCNFGWMSNLESAVSKLVGPLSRDIEFWLTVEGQTLIARWAVKTSMVLESLDRRAYGKYGHAQQERDAIRSGTCLPARTQIWMGRYAQTGLGAFGDRFDLNVPKIPVICGGRKTNFIIGHLLIQAISIVAPAKYDHIAIPLRVKAAPWRRALIQIWPATSQTRWPPPLSFSARGDLRVADLIDRLERTI